MGRDTRMIGVAGEESLWCSDQVANAVLRAPEALPELRARSCLV